MVHKPSSSDRVVSGIIENFLSGRYVPGQKLIEGDLARVFSLSRGPIREALKRLAAEGVIRLSPHRGAFIRSFTRRELDELLIVLEYLVGLMARQAASAVKHGNDPEPIREAYQLLSPFIETGTEDLSYIEHRRHFYEALNEIGGNKQLGRLMPTIEIHIIRAQFLSFMTVDERKARLNEYAGITNAVLAGDAKRAEQVARKHIAETKKRLSRLPDSAFSSDE
jgi:DNA-binding GntR family transcriptional regulator